MVYLELHETSKALATWCGAPTMFMQMMPAACNLSTAHFGGTPTAQTKSFAPERTRPQ